MDMSVITSQLDLTQKRYRSQSKIFSNFNFLTFTLCTVKIKSAKYVIFEEILHGYLKVVLEGYHRYFFGVKVKTVKLIGGRRFLEARSGLMV